MARCADPQSTQSLVRHEDSESDELTPGVRRFVEEYVKDHNYADAFRRSGLPGYISNPSFGGSLLARRPEVARAIANLEGTFISDAAKVAQLELKRLFHEIARGAFFDVRKLFHEDGSPKAIHELDEDIASAIAGFEVQETGGSGDGPVRRTFKYKLADRARWADMGMKALGGYKRDNEQANPVNALVDLLQNMSRSAIPVVQEVERDGTL